MFVNIRDIRELVGKEFMKTIKLAINGFGRIGRQAFKIALEKPEMEVWALMI